MTEGEVYILTNSAMPGLVKIGRTARGVDILASELFQTGVPQPFDVLWKERTPDCVQLEAYVHGALKSRRCNKAREFFRMDALEAMEALRWWARFQAQEIVDRFSGGFSISRPDCRIEEAAMHRMATEAGVSIWRIRDAIAGLTGDDLRAAVKKSFERSPYLLTDDDDAFCGASE